jgi:protein Shroom
LVYFNINRLNLSSFSNIETFPLSFQKILEVKRDRLREQLTEAKQLKDDIDRRGAIISKILEKSLNNDEFGDYEYFINMKAKLIVDSREIADKIKLGEDQLIALKETIVHSEC